MNIDQSKMPAVKGRLKQLSDSTVGPPALLLLAAVVGLVWVNIGDSYHRLWERTLTLGSGERGLSEDLQGWVNEGLMVLFFFGVGLEVKRELVIGELQDKRRAALPAIAALGGMVVPAIIYLAINALSAAGESAGWAIPVATDIAFTLGVLSLLGSRVPAHLRLFILTLAIVDDVGGVIIIAIGFSEGIEPAYLAAAGGVLVAIRVLHGREVAPPLAYLPLGIALWYCVWHAGVEPTIAGVVLGLMTPATRVKGRDVLEELEDFLRPLTALIILPLFAMANTGVRIDGDVVRDAFTSPVAAGVVLGLVVGKTVGITMATHLALRLGIGALHESVNPRLVAPAALLAGIGFTVALFIAELTFTDPAVLDEAKLGILAGSVMAGVLGTVAYRGVHRRLAGAGVGTW